MGTTNLRCGIAIPQSFTDIKADVDVELIRAFLGRAEELGYESLWVQEQIITDTSLIEPVTLLAYAAALTSKARLGTSVLLPVIRNVVQLAKSLASLDQLSRGRLIVGLGIGGPHVAESVFGAGGEHRGRRFVESVEVLKALWTQPRATVDGEFWRFKDVPMEPKPLQKPHPPIWFGARTEIGLRRAVKHGDGWMGAGSSSSADFIGHVGMLREQLGRAGRDPATFMVSKRVYIAVDDNRARAEQRLREWFAARYKNADMAARVSIWGGRAECIDRLAELVRAGARYLLLNPVFDEMEHLELLAADLIPQL